MIGAILAPASAQQQLTVALRVGVSVPTQPCQISAPSQLAIDPLTGKPTLTTASQVTNGCSTPNVNFANFMQITQQTFSDGSYVATINF